MASETNVNAILGQGHAIKNIYNVKKQNLELQQQFAAQHMEVEKKKDKVKIGSFETDNKVDLKEEGKKRDKKNSKKSRKKPNGKTEKKEETKTEGSLIDIKV